MPTSNAECYMCANWDQDKCNGVFGRCCWQEEQAMEGVYQGGGPKPRWIECWMDGGADASRCDGFQITQAGQHELDIINADSIPDGYRRNNAPEWVAGGR